MQICKNCNSSLFKTQDSSLIKLDGKIFYLIEDKEDPSELEIQPKTEYSSKNFGNQKPKTGTTSKNILKNLKDSKIKSKSILGGGKKFPESGVLKGDEKLFSEYLNGDEERSEMVTEHGEKIKEEKNDYSKFNGGIKFFNLRDPEISKKYLSFDSFFMKVSF